MDWHGPRAALKPFPPRSAASSSIWLQSSPFGRFANRAGTSVVLRGWFPARQGASECMEIDMKLTTTLLAAATVIALSAPSYAQVTPGGAGERHLNESPSTAGKAGTMPTTAPEHAVAPKKMMKGTT